ncbi:heparinase II/III family protein [Paenibacillus protaetiae]|uniref:Heparinase n=1 Tax=Paenibacillus protaetiae TaxID=2509456 RepID=A0A4P6F4A7_9BACL|nr:heparinase II/III family protein [Paenibacillus protaetiae]QAY68007.1 hypothetical protein ET464_18140 [Paenibacillus protaetiae]
MYSSSEIREAVRQLEPVNERLYYPEGGRLFWQKVLESDDYTAVAGEIRSEGERLLAEPIPALSYKLFMRFEEQGSRLEYESVYFERRRRLNTFVLLSLLEPEETVYAEQRDEIIWAVCNEYTWCLPAHVRSTQVTGAIDLFAAETAFTLAEMLVLLGGRLPAMLRVRIREELERRLFRPYLEGGPFSWERADHNWAAVCAGSVGAAALLVMEEQERLADVLEKALGSMGSYLSGFGEDGACLEGIGYWNYGFGYYVYFADLLKQRTSGRLNLFAGDKIRQIALFQQKCYLGGDMTANFSDSLARTQVQLGLSHYLSRIYPDIDVPPLQVRAAFTDDHCSRWAPAFRNMIWYDQHKQAAEWRAADYVLPDAQWVVSRHQTACGSFGFAAKGGHNGEPHNHNDVGHFIVYADGYALLHDLGSGEYTADYFGAGRYAIDCNGSQSHSVPIVDGRRQAAGAEYAARGTEAELAEHAVSFRADLAGAYEPGAVNSLVRSLIWHKQELPVLTLADEYAFNRKPVQVVERFVTPYPPHIGEDAVWVKPPGAKHALRIRYDEQAVVASAGSHTYSNHFGVNTPWYTIDFTLVQPALQARVELSFELALQIQDAGSGM